jgi:hypothetical protein
METLSKNYDLSNVNDLKEILCQQVDTRTEETIFSGFTFDNKQFSLSISAQINWSNLFNIPQMMFPLTVSCKDETTYSLSYGNVQNFYFSALMAKNNALQNGTQKKQAILVCSTIEELQIIGETI